MRPAISDSYVRGLTGGGRDVTGSPDAAAQRAFSAEAAAQCRHGQCGRARRRVSGSVAFGRTAGSSVAAPDDVSATGRASSRRQAGIRFPTSPPRSRDSARRHARCGTPVTVSEKREATGRSRPSAAKIVASITAPPLSADLSAAKLSQP